MLSLGSLGCFCGVFRDPIKGQYDSLASLKWLFLLECCVWSSVQSVGPKFELLPASSWLGGSGQQGLVARPKVQSIQIQGM